MPENSDNEAGGTRRTGRGDSPAEHRDSGVKDAVFGVSP